MTLLLVKGKHFLYLNSFVSNKFHFLRYAQTVHSLLTDKYRQNILFFVRCLIFFQCNLQRIIDHVIVSKKNSYHPILIKNHNFCYTGLLTALFSMSNQCFCNVTIGISSKISPLEYYLTSFPT